ncbi:hypothetical protein [Amycolatopsis rifamycinica]|uniref:hypothetical protein n=1 Tax=Amycolatopsis rifamycinica TaxID=287986 RepID=UPI0012699B94|nr:hypothetical protein [Amycolatopsis rifamycinica]
MPRFTTQRISLIIGAAIAVASPSLVYLVPPLVNPFFCTGDRCSSAGTIVGAGLALAVGFFGCSLVRYATVRQRHDKDR